MFSRLSRWQWTTVATLTVGYMGYYFCRSNFSVATPLLLDAYGDQGLTKESIGAIASIGTLLYASGKLFNGVLCDFVGGRRMFLVGMVASVVCTIAFGLGWGFAAFLVAWSANRAVQSMGWGALVKTASHWFPLSMMGSILGILCLSYLFGDVLARLFLGQLINAGVGWRGIFFAAAAVLALIFVVANFTLKRGPAEVGEEEPEANPHNLFGAEGNAEKPDSLLDLLMPFLTSLSFWLICIMNFGLTMIRESFNFWTPTYLVEIVQMSEGGAAQASSLFPFFGGLSVLAAGVLSDRVMKGRRGAVMFLFLLPSVFGLLALSRLQPGVSPWLALGLISLIGFLMLGPYAFLTGVISVDLGGKKGSATAAGLADTVGYIGGIASGYWVGRLAERHGWSTAFGFLAAVLAATTLAALIYWYVHEHRPDKKAATIL